MKIYAKIGTHPSTTIRVIKQRRSPKQGENFLGVDLSASKSSQKEETYFVYSIAELETGGPYIFFVERL